MMKKQTQNNYTRSMNYYQYRLKTLLIFLMLSSLFSQKILHMNGTYDLDGDNMLLEFLALELDPDKDVFPTAVRFYEIDSDGYQTLIWEFIPPVALEGEFVDAQVGDIDEVWITRFNTGHESFKIC